MTATDSGPHGPIEDRSYLWPPFAPARKPLHTLAYLAGQTIHTEDGAAVECPDWPALKAAISSLNLQVYASTLNMTGYVEAAAGDPTASVSVAPDAGQVTYLYFKQGKRSYGVALASAWGVAADLAGIRTIRRVLHAGGIGDYATAGSWGQALMRHYYPRGLPRLANLSLAYYELVKRNLIGGRVDTKRLGARFDTAYEYDMNSAYAAAMMHVPVGSPGWLTADGADDLPDVPTAFLSAVVTYPDGLALSPLPHRDEDGLVHYPESGTVEGWYWLEELQVARSVGCTIRWKEGIYWRLVDDRFRRWVETMMILRKRLDPDAAALVKIATVAGIGRFAAQLDTHTLTTEPQEGDRPFTDPDAGLDNPYYIHTESTPRPGLLPHLFSHATMQCRLETYMVARAAAEAGTLIATNYDAVYTSEPLDVPLGPELGQWKVATLTHAEVPAARHLVSDQKIRKPGVRR